MSRWFVGGALAVAVGCSAAPHAVAQSFPARTITFVVPNTAGGSSDLIARSVAAKLQDALGRTVVVENKPGASEMIASEMLANGVADGHTIAIFSNALAINETLSPGRRYEALRDFIPVARLAALPFAVMVRASLPAGSLAELVALAKAQPGKLSYAHVGVGAPHYLTMEWLKRAAGIDVVAVPYKSSPPALAGLLSGDIDVMIGALGAATPLIQSGKMRALAAMSAKRPTLLPSLPTVAELGYPEFDLVPWMGVFVRSGTPADIVQRLESELVRSARAPDVRAYLDSIGLEAAPLGSGDFRALLERDIASWAKVIRDVGVKPQ